MAKQADCKKSQFLFYDGFDLYTKSLHLIKWLMMSKYTNFH